MIRSLLNAFGLQKPVSKSLDLLPVSRKEAAGLVQTAAPVVGRFAGASAGNSVVPVVGGFLGGHLGKQIGQQVGNEVADFILYA
jgi:hypothetical protein